MGMFDIIEQNGDYYIGRYNLPMCKPFEVGKFSDSPKFFGHRQKHKRPVAFRPYKSEALARKYFNKLVNA